MSGKQEGDRFWQNNLHAADVLCLVDSVGLRRANGQPEGEPAVSYLELTQSLLNESGHRLQMGVDALTGRTSAAVFEYLRRADLLVPDIVFLQVGVVDSAPRVLGPRGRALVGYIHPVLLRKQILNCLATLHKRWFFLLCGHRLLVAPAEFLTNMRASLARLRTLGVRHALVASILPTTRQRERVYVGIQQSIAEYNRLLKLACNESGATFVDFTPALGTEPQEWLYDGVHPNIAGKHRLARILADHLAAVCRQCPIFS